MPCSSSAATVLGAIAAREDSGVNAWVQRLHPAVEHLREAGEILDPRDRPARPPRAPPPCPRSRRARSRARSGRSREVRDAGLVVDGDQRAHSSRTTFGSSRCSASCTRSRNVSTVSPASTGTGSLAITSPVSTPSSTKCTVAAAAGGTRGEHVLERVRAREGGKRRRMHVHDAAGEAGEERRPQQVHVPGADDELDAVPLEPVRHRAVALVAIGVVARAERQRSALRRPRPASSALRVVDVRRHRDDRQLARREVPAGSSPRRSRGRRSRADDPPDHELVAGVGHDREIPDPEVEHTP